MMMTPNDDDDDDDDDDCLFIHGDDEEESLGSPKACVGIVLNSEWMSVDCFGFLRFGPRNHGTWLVVGAFSNPRVYNCVAGRELVVTRFCMSRGVPRWLFVEAAAEPSPTTNV